MSNYNYTALIDAILKDGEFMDGVESIQKGKFNYLGIYQVLEPIADKFFEIRNTILESISSKAFEEDITFVRKSKIYEALLIINKEVKLVKDLNTSSKQNNTFNRISPDKLRLSFENFFEEINLARLIEIASDNGYKDYITKLKEIDQFKFEFEEAKKTINSFNKSFEEIQNEFNQVYSIKEKLLEIFKNAESKDLVEMKKILDQFDFYSLDLQSSITDFQKKRDKIDTFIQKIDISESKLQDIKDRSSLLDEQTGKISDIIKKAESALQVSSSYGISAAFSEYHSEAKNSGRVSVPYWFKMNLEKKKLEKKVLFSFNSWMFGAFIFILGAILGTIWVLTGWGIESQDSESIGSVLGRIAVVGICITSAAFCARQYNKNKVIAEDYAYKSVIAKSINAFSGEIKNINDTKIVDYLEKVLHEIHKDPQRARKDTDVNNTVILEKLVDKISDLVKKN